MRLKRAQARRGPCALLEQALQAAHLVEDLLEPELVDLVDDDEEHLVVFRAVAQRPLQRQQLVDLEVARVGERLARGHQKSRWPGGGELGGSCGLNMVSRYTFGVTPWPGRTD